MDRDDYQSERAFYLEAFNGDGPFTFDRIGRGTIHIPCCTLSMIGGIQPSRISSLVAAAYKGMSDGIFFTVRFAVHSRSDRHTTKPSSSGTDRKLISDFVSSTRGRPLQPPSASPQRPRAGHAAPRNLCHARSGANCNIPSMNRVLNLWTKPARGASFRPVRSHRRWPAAEPSSKRVDVSVGRKIGNGTQLDVRIGPCSMPTLSAIVRMVFHTFGGRQIW